MAAALRSAGHRDVTVRRVLGRSHMSVWTEMLDEESEETSSSILLFARRILSEKANEGRGAARGGGAPQTERGW